eukprot:CAMPEP_0202886188 /NCGR_PEP_ID=MMETSP1391-20130828/42049_1 /ASSEMBLY_ACC=CAM_ASM_000867 /TAXON_ID=1034604 /ORGANISM="Chlamydomonas leiostraca, Strain SAG 11-49" /LENGTH=73 /DNA_ID=CAMNT_0049569457 /DNA_START=755 /DNA_END=976 /DNA_ORIENTATION=+
MAQGVARCRRMARPDMALECELTLLWQCMRAGIGRCEVLQAGSYPKLFSAKCGTSPLAGEERNRMLQDVMVYA